LKQKQPKRVHLRDRKAGEREKFCSYRKDAGRTEKTQRAVRTLPFESKSPGERGDVARGHKHQIKRRVTTTQANATKGRLTGANSKT